MKLLNRILLYIILILGYCFSTFIYFNIGKLPFKDFFWNAVLIFSIMDILVAFLFIKHNPITNILLGILIAYLSLLSAFKFSDFYYPPSDAYGINTTIITNILFSIISWEIAFQINKKLTAIAKNSE